MKRSTKRTIKTILMGVLGVGLLVGAVSLVSSLVGKNDDEIAMKTIHPTFEIGGLNEDGKYLETDTSIYTKKAFECLGLEIKLEFDNTISYQVFYYESDGDFISSTDVLSDNTNLVVPGLATHARVQVIPNWDEMGEEYEDEENQVIKWYQVSKFSNQINFRVNKEQKMEMDMNKYLNAILGEGRVNSFKYDEQGKGLYTTSGTFDNSNENGIWYWGSEINTTDKDELYVVVETSVLNSTPVVNGNQKNPLAVFSKTESKYISTQYEVLIEIDNYSIIKYDVSETNSVFVGVVENGLETTQVFLR